LHTAEQSKPILLFDGECGVCRRIASWVQKSEREKSGDTSIIERPIGEDPEALRSLNPDLDIWDAYATIHLLMPDGTMKLGGEAVAEVLRHLPGTQWFTWTFAFSVFGFRPFQAVVNLAYTILADIRPLFGCESCGTPSAWIRPIRWTIKRAEAALAECRQAKRTLHFTPLSATATARRTLPVTPR
jgi:predicted DCC family thiol-disulfide oxidoreductase YuxK